MDRSITKTTRQGYRIDKREISFFRFILEGWEGVATLTTIDPGRGAVVISIAPGCEEDVTRIIEGLQSEMMIEPIALPDNAPNVTSEL